MVVSTCHFCLKLKRNDINNKYTHSFSILELSVKVRAEQIKINRQTRRLSKDRLIEKEKMLVADMNRFYKLNNA